MYRPNLVSRYISVRTRRHGGRLQEVAQTQFVLKKKHAGLQLAEAVVEADTSDFVSRTIGDSSNQLVSSNQSACSNQSAKAELLPVCWVECALEFYLDTPRPAIISR